MRELVLREVRHSRSDDRDDNRDDRQEESSVVAAIGAALLPIVEPLLNQVPVRAIGSVVELGLYGRLVGRLELPIEFAFVGTHEPES